MLLTNLPPLLLAIAMVKCQHSTMEPIAEVPDCCIEKKVGSVTYTLVTAMDEVPDQRCLNGCVYTVANTSSPEFCFGRG